MRVGEQLGGVEIMDQPSLPEPRVVVGLDFGTTFSGFAYAHTSAPDDIFTQYDWPMFEQGGGKSYCKTLTGVYYESGSDGKLVFKSWGWPARVAYLGAMRAALQAKKKTGVEGDAPPVGEMLTKFKLHLAGENDGPPSVENLPGDLTPDQVISDYLRGIGEFIITELQSRYGNMITKEVVQWCLTVPSIWDDHAKQQMKLCMEKAGLVKGAVDIQASPYPVIVILEPEAASIYCHRCIKSDLHLQLGDKFLVVDLGGGTTDIVVQARANHTGALKVKEVSRSSGGLCGGTYVDQSFMAFLREKIGCLEEFLVQHPEHEPKILGWWESAKSTFDGSPNFQAALQMSANLARAWEEYEKASSYDTCVTEFDEVEFSCDDMKTIFDPVVDQNLSLIEEKLTEHPDIKVIMAVGGFSGSPYMMARIKETFASRVAEIISPPHPGSAVCQGAVALALHADTILSRVARKTYGISTMLKFEPGDREDYREVVDGTAKCKNRFDVFVQRGQQVDTDYSVSKTYVPTYSKQKAMNISLFSSDDDAPRYTEGANVTKEGTFVVDMSDGAEELNRERQVKVTMYFGRSTVELKAQGVNFGENKVHEMLPVRFDGDFE